MTSSQPEANEAARSLKYISEYVAPFNAAILLAMTVIDLATPQLRGSSSRWLALVMALAIIALAFRLRHVARMRAANADPRSVLAIFVGDRRHWWAIAAVVTGVFLLGAHLTAQASTPRGLLADTVPGLDGLQEGLAKLLQRTEAIKEDTAVIKAAVSPADPRGQLRVMGYGLDVESKARAIEACDLAAVLLYIEIGERLPLAVPVFGVRGGSVLERPILEANTRLRLCCTNRLFGTRRLVV